MTTQQNEEGAAYGWRFPCYILARGHRIDPETGEVIWDEKVRLLTPEMQKDGERVIAIFTDLYLAEDFRDHMKSRVKVEPVCLRTPTELMVFLDWAHPRYRRLLVDPSRQHLRPTLVIEILVVIREIIRQTGDQDHPS